MAVAGAFAVAAACTSGTDERTNDAPKIPGYDGPSLPPTPGPLPLEQLGDAFETILCEALQRCQQANYRDTAECRLDREPEGLADVMAGVAEGRVRYDPEAMGECRRLFEQNLCSVTQGFLFVPSVPDVVSLCMFGSGGTGDEGAPCRSAMECRRELYCDDAASCPAVCRARLVAGQACGGNDECAPVGPVPEVTLSELVRGGQDLVRQIEVSSADCFDGVCRPPSAPGDPCVESATPTVGLGGCVGNTTFCDAATTRCLARRRAGESCASDEQCAAGYFCDAPSGSAASTCAAESAEGGPCFEVSHCAGSLRCLAKDASGRGQCLPPSTNGACESSSDCADGYACAEGRCQALPGSGSNCLGSDCAPDAVCVGSVCRSVSHAAEPCDTEHPCLGVCRVGTCFSRSPLGAPCAAGDECASRSCSNGACVDGELCENR